MPFIMKFLEVVGWTVWALVVLSFLCNMVKRLLLELAQDLFEFYLKKRIEFIEEMERKFDGDKEELERRRRVSVFH
jgi:hypothetical protein